MCGFSTLRYGRDETSDLYVRDGVILPCTAPPAGVPRIDGTSLLVARACGTCTSISAIGNGAAETRRTALPRRRRRLHAGRDHAQ
jgi:hypothetical protein